jgi:hypothetical protein
MARMTERERVLLVARLFDLLKDALRYGLYAWVAWAIFLSVRELAGKSTDARFVFEYFFSRDNDYALPWILATVTTVWALLERKFRHQKTEQLTARTKELELRLDPHRSSSGLATTGETHPRDKWVP